MVIPGSRIEFAELNVNTKFPIYVKLEANRKELPVDIYFLADNTGSMSAAISIVKSRVFEVIEAVKGDRRFAEPRVGVGAYKDEGSSGTDERFIHLQSITSNEILAQAAVDRNVVERGADRDKANLVALCKVAKDARIGWRGSSRKVVTK